MFSPTTQALEKFDNSHDFERLAADYLNASGNSHVVPIAVRGGSDGGKDITYQNPSSEDSLAFVSLEKNAMSKFKKDAAKHKSGDFKEYTFFTTQYLTSAQKVELIKLCAEKLDAPLLIKDIEAIRSVLDTRHQDLRKRYLYIDEDIELTYSLKVTNLTTYNVDNEINKSVARLNETTAKYRANSSMAGVIPILFPALGSKTTDEVITGLTKHVEELTKLGNKLVQLVSFNVELVAGSYDENIQVEINCKDPLIFDFEDMNLDLPKYPSASLNTNLMSEIFDIGFTPSMPSSVHRDDSEFYAKLGNHSRTVRSNLSVLNPHQPKFVFDKPVFVLGNTDFNTIVLEAKIYSKNLKSPVIQEITIEPSESSKTIKLEYAHTK